MASRTRTSPTGTATVWNGGPSPSPFGAVPDGDPRRRTPGRDAEVRTLRGRLRRDVRPERTRLRCLSNLARGRAVARPRYRSSRSGTAHFDGNRARRFRRSRPRRPSTTTAPRASGRSCAPSRRFASSRPGTSRTTDAARTSRRRPPRPSGRRRAETARPSACPTVIAGDFNDAQSNLVPTSTIRRRARRRRPPRLGDSPLCRRQRPRDDHVSAFSTPACRIRRSTGSGTPRSGPSTARRKRNAATDSPPQRCRPPRRPAPTTS